jgi:addiction module HigA family antidote
MGKYECARPVHPGEILKEEIEYRGISQGKLATQMGISYKMLNQILNERRPLTPQTAMLFEAVLDINSDLLMRMQLKYNMQVVNRDKSFLNRLAEIRKKVAVFTFFCHPV